MLLAQGIENVDSIPFSDIPWYKFSKKGATKEKAIESLCAHLNVAPQKIAAFGDDFNDIGMLKIAGKGLSMQNAIPEVKHAAFPGKSLLAKQALPTENEFFRFGYCKVLFCHFISSTISLLLQELF